MTEAEPSLRKSISKSVRFEVFKRDSFTCQYCGKKVPDVTLEIEHIKPVSKGGTNDLLNLVAACEDCNSGKSDKLLSDFHILDKQRNQAELLQARREQIEMMFEWQQGLKNIDADLLSKLGNVWKELVPGFSINDAGLLSIKKLLKRFSLEEVLTAMRAAAESYLVMKNGVPTPASVELAFSKIGGICKLTLEEKEDPDVKKLYYIRGIIRKKFSYCDENKAIQILKEMRGEGLSIEELQQCAIDSRSWSQWRKQMSAIIEERAAADLARQKAESKAQSDSDIEKVMKLRRNSIVDGMWKLFCDSHSISDRVGSLVLSRFCEAFPIDEIAEGLVVLSERQDLSSLEGGELQKNVGAFVGTSQVAKLAIRRFPKHCEEMVCLIWDAVEWDISIDKLWPIVRDSEDHRIVESSIRQLIDIRKSASAQGD